MPTISYIDAVMTLAACKDGYDEMTKEEFAQECFAILEEDGNFKDPEAGNG